MAEDRPSGAEARGRGEVAPSLATSTTPRGPVAAFPRRGLALAALPLCLALGLGLASCGAPSRLPCRYPADARYAASLDSLGAAGFAALPPPAQAERARLAALALQRGLASGRAATRLAALRTAVGLDPTSAAAWLELGRVQRLLGNPEAAMPALDQAWQAAAAAPAAARDDLRLRIATAMGWVDYDRGEWQRGLDWVARAEQIQPAQREVMLIKGLLQGGALRRYDATNTAHEIERLDYFLSDWRWIRGMADLRLGWLKEAENEMADARPSLQHASDFWRDQGEMYTQIGDWHKARRAYGRQAEALPLDRGSCLTMVERRHPDADPGAPLLPAWLAFDRFLVAGSLPTYARVALERFEAARDAGEREFWAEACIAASTYAIRRGLRPAWGHAWRGRVYAQLDLPQDAQTDLVRAVDLLRRQGRRDAPTLYWLGHLQLKNKQYEPALANLRQAVQVDAELAPAWSDVGYALVMLGRMPEAGEALDRAVALDPQLAVAWYNRGLLNFNGRHWREAMADFERAARLAPANREITDMLQRTRLLLRQQGSAGGDGGADAGGTNGGGTEGGGGS